MTFHVPEDCSTLPAAVIGAGTIGRRIALTFAAHGVQVKIYDLAEAQRDAVRCGLLRLSAGRLSAQTALSCRVIQAVIGSRFRYGAMLRIARSTYSSFSPTGAT